MTLSPPRHHEPDREGRSLGSLLAEHLAELEAERDVVARHAAPPALPEPPTPSGPLDHSGPLPLPTSPGMSDLPPREADPEQVVVLPIGESVVDDPAAAIVRRWADDHGEQADPPANEEPADLEPVALESVAVIADQLDDDVVDADDVVADLARLGVDDDEAARRRFGMSLHGVGVSVLAHLQHRRNQPGLRRAPARRPYLKGAAVRSALYAGPLAVGLAAAPALASLGALVPAVVLLLGWSAALALTSVGTAVAVSAGAAPAARLVGGGFLAAGGVWSALVWVAPDAWLGGGRLLALMVGWGLLTALGTVTAALVTRTEAAVVAWSLPCWLLGALTVAAALGDGWVDRVPAGTLLPAAIVVAAVRAYRPVIMRRVPGRPRLQRGDLRRGLGHLVLGAAQAGTALLIWRAAPGGTAVLAALPLLFAVPALEALVGWHLHQVEAGLDLAESDNDHRAHLRSVAVTTVAALLPPLAAGIALAAAASRLPHGVSAPEGIPAIATGTGVLAVAAGTLAGGLLAITVLLAARRRTAIAATLAAVTPLTVLALPFKPGPPLAALPAVVAVLAAAHLLGLLLVAYTSTDHRRLT